MTAQLWLIPALPLLGFLLNGVLGKSLGKPFVSLVGPGVIGISFVLSVLAFMEMLDAPSMALTQTLFTWIEAGDFYVPVEFTVDRLSGLYILIITGVGFLIHVYSVGYMGGEEGYHRYFAYLNLFIFFMLLLVLGASFLLLFVGWEGVGLCSYLLIGFYYERDSAARAAKKAFVVNRIGDFGLIVATLIIFVVFGSLDFADVLERAPYVLETGGVLVTAITLLLFLAAAGKSAQIPLYVWLPDAMEGPTPVSALIHAATMVTAGLYVIARLSVLFVMSPFTLSVIIVVGTATAFFAATIGLAQNDIKRVLAYSTVSQLGYMFMAMGVGAFTVGIFHVLTHAFFKALLFLGSGSVILGVHHEQDMTKMGGLRAKMPITAITFIIGAFAISGFPFIFAGFFSKDEILWQVFSSPAGNPVYWIIGALTAVMTAFYMFRTVALTFYGASRVDPHHADDVRESPWTMTVPLIVLAVLSIAGGWLGIPHVLGGFVGLHNYIGGYFDGFFATLPAEGAHYGITVELLLMGISTGAALIAMWLAFRLFAHRRDRAEQMKSQLAVAHRVLSNKYYIDELYDWLIINPIHWFSDKVLWRIVDVRIIDGLVNATGYTTRNIGGALRLMQNGLVENYAIGIALGTIVIIWYLVL